MLEINTGRASRGWNSKHPPTNSIYKGPWHWAALSVQLTHNGVDVISAVSRLPASTGSERESLSSCVPFKRCFHLDCVCVSCERVCVGRCWPPSERLKLMEADARKSGKMIVFSSNLLMGFECPASLRLCAVVL